MKRVFLAIFLFLGILLISLVSAAFTPSYLDNNLVSYYDFETGSGTTVVDSLNLHNMTSNSSTWVTGKVGNYGMNFSASNSELARTTSNVTQIQNTSYTINGWVKLNIIGRTYSTVWIVGNNYNIPDGT
ncbi:MAG: hypothetical protein AABY22_22120, partial [Nanoarchaeota archaeon]